MTGDPARRTPGAPGVVERDGDQPLHVQVAGALRQEVRDRRLVPGTALASEVALVARFGVSRSVVRQALATLAAEGLVARGRGRGTVVAPAREHHRLVTRSSGLFAQLAAEGLAVTTQVLALVEQDAPAEARWLGTARVLRLERLRRVDGHPLARIRTWLPLPACAALAGVDLTDASLHQVLDAELGLTATTGPRQVRAVAAGAELAGDLDVPLGAPLLLLEGRTGDQLGRPLEVFATWHRAGDVAFDLQAGGDGGAPGRGPGELRRAAEQARALAEHLEALAGG